MQTDGNAVLKAFFARMAYFSRKHLAEATPSGPVSTRCPIWRRTTSSGPTAPRRRRPPGPASMRRWTPATRCCWRSTAKRRGHAYYAAIAATTSDAELRALAGEFAAEEAQHVAELEKLIAARTSA